MVLRKVAWGAIVGFIVLALRTFGPDLLPGLEIPEGLENAINLLIVFITQFFVRETPATVSRLVLKK